MIRNLQSGRYESNESLRERFIRQTCYVGDCIIWTGVLTHEGYGRMKINRRFVMATHIAMQLEGKEIRKGFNADHLCRNPACVNVAHIEEVTPRENTLRGVGPGAMARRTNLCKLGHSLALGDAYIYKGVRHCRKCRIIRHRNWRRRKRGALLLS